MAAALSECGSHSVQMRRLMEDLFPLCRSITGAGTRSSLDRLRQEIPLHTTEVPSGTQVLDWTVPAEWTINDAYVTRAGDGERLIDFRSSNLHLVSYSAPIRQRMSLDELRPHLHHLADRPTLIPYRTTYYETNWGFCLAGDELAGWTDGQYDVVIDSGFHAGAMVYGELVVPGRSSEEVVLTTHICHPSLANDNLSGVAVVSELAKELLGRADLRYTYRMLFIPGTIGSIAWLATHPDVIARIRHGLVLTGLGDAAPLTYKRSRRGTSDTDRLTEMLLAQEPMSRVLPFTPYGYDERQFCSPGFDLPIGRLTRGVHGEYPEYHTSADNLDFVSDSQLDASLRFLIRFVEAIEANYSPRNTCPFGEPQLGRRELYASTGGAMDHRSVEMAYLWVLNLADGAPDLCTIASQSGLAFEVIVEAARRLQAAGLLEDASRLET